MDERKAPDPDGACDDDHRKEDESTRPPAKITPVKTRVGEGADNLRRRQEWFRKRSSGSE